MQTTLAYEFLYLNRIRKNPWRGKLWLQIGREEDEIVLSPVKILNREDNRFLVQFYDPRPEYHRGGIELVVLEEDMESNLEIITHDGIFVVSDEGASVAPMRVCDNLWRLRHLLSFKEE